MTRLIATDLDNTLLDDSRTISPFTANVLDRCRSRGMLLAFVTARPERAVRILGYSPDICVCNNGATLIHDGQATHLNIPEDTLWSLLACLLAEPAISCVTAEAGDRLYSNYTGQPWGEGWETEYTDFARRLPMDVCKLSAECLDKAKVQDIVSAYPGLHAYPDFNGPWSHIMTTEATKAKGLARAVQLLGIDLADVVAFGDDANDIDLLRVCGTGVAVGNAIAAVKAVADHICLSNMNDGVARWLLANVL